jgi:hypothetical protein
MNLFWILWGIDALIALIALYFFFIGLVDGSVSSFNIGIWGLLLIGLAVIVFGSLWLKSVNQLGLAKGLLSILAIPGILYALFILMILIGNPRWN